MVALRADWVHAACPVLAPRAQVPGVSSSELRTLLQQNKNDMEAVLKAIRK